MKLRFMWRFVCAAAVGWPVFIAGAEPAGAPAAESASGIAARLEPFVASRSLAGAVTVVADREKVLALDTVGYADVAEKQPMRPDSLFWIASMTKPITGAGLMILVDEGKVALDDPIDKHLPEFRDLWLVDERTPEKLTLKRPARKVTVRDIMNHTSGMAFSGPLEKPTLDGLPLSVAVGSYALTPLLTEPGKKWAYSNEGINAAGRIIEVVSGMPYEKFMQDRLFGPLGMRDTTFFPTAEQAARLAKTYKPNAAKNDLEATQTPYLIHPPTAPNRYAMPGGGLFSTAADVATFGRMVLNGGELDGKRYLSEKSVETMISKTTEADVPNGYGVGWAVQGHLVGHGGALATDLKLDRKRGLVLVYLVQHMGFPGNGGSADEAFLEAAYAKFGK